MEMKRGLAILFALLIAVPLPAVTQPTLPQATVSLAMPTLGGSTCATPTTGTNCIRNVTSGNATSLQNVLNAAGPGDTVVLPVATYSGNFTIPATSCTGSGGWVIESANLASLPASGTRIGSGDFSNMPIISTPNSSPALAFLPSTCNVRIIGVEVTTSYTSGTTYWLVGMGFQSDGATNLTVQAQLPQNIIIDRSYIYGGASAGNGTAAVDHGVVANSQAFGIVDSYCDQIADTVSDNQCVVSWNGSGPFLIQNNFLQASSENIMFGGADPAITNLVPSDITIIGNLIQKKLTWCAPSPPYNTCSVSPALNVKNLVELKNAQRLLLDGNVLQNTWAANQAEAVIIRSVNQSGACTWCVVQDVTVTHNLIAHAPCGVQLAYSEDANSLATQRVLVQNNVETDISSANWGSGFGAFAAFTGANPTASSWIIDHNTAFNDSRALQMGDSGTVNNFQFTNNIVDYGSYGIIGSGVGSGTIALSTYASGYTYNDVVFMTTTQAGYPAGTLWSTNLAGVGFTGATGSDPNVAGNLQLTNGSAYHNAGTDGKDIGVYDWTCFNAETAAALAGTFTAATYCGPVNPSNTPAAPSNVMILFAAKK